MKVIKYKTLSAVNYLGKLETSTVLNEELLQELPLIVNVHTSIDDLYIKSSSWSVERSDDKHITSKLGIRSLLAKPALYKSTEVLRNPRVTWFDISIRNVATTKG